MVTFVKKQFKKPPQYYAIMYVERNVFRLKFGAGREAISLWKEYLSEAVKTDPGLRVNMLTDISGPAYTLILELTYASFSELEPALCRLTNGPGWKTFYQKFIPLCDHSERTYYRVHSLDV
jgi:hypothetical protein